MAIDPGAEFSRPRTIDLAFIMEWLERHPFASLATGEGKMLFDEIMRLRGLLHAGEGYGIPPEATQAFDKQGSAPSVA